MIRLSWKFAAGAIKNKTFLSILPELRQFQLPGSVTVLRRDFYLRNNLFTKIISDLYHRAIVTKVIVSGDCFESILYPKMFKKEASYLSTIIYLKP